MRFIFLALGYHPDLAGGAYRYTTEVASRLAGRGHEVEVLCPNPGGHPVWELRAGVSLRRFPDAPGWFAINWLRENRAARKLLSALVASTNKPSLLVCQQAFFAPCLAGCSLPTIFFFYGPWGLEYLFSRSSRPRGLGARLLDRGLAGVMRMVERWALRRARRILVISNYYLQQMPVWHGQRLPPLSLVSGGVNTDQFQPPSDRALARQELGLKPTDSLFLTVRRLDPRMGLIHLIDGFTAVAQDHPQAQLWLAGDGPQRGALEARMAALGLRNQVRILGFVPEAELPRLYGAADCTVVPSLDLEGFGLATVESLACGTPVLGSAAGATPELLAPLSSDLLFPPASPPALADKLRAVLSGRLVLPAREHCADYARTQFSWARPVSALEQAFRDLCT